jgi:hypothetical protein
MLNSDFTGTMNDVSGPGPARPARALPARNMWRGGAATLLRPMLVAAAWILLTASLITERRTFASAPMPAPAPAAPQQLATEHPPPVEQVRAAHAMVRAWLDRFATPSLSSPESHVAIDRASAVCVILRRHGRAMGVGIDASGDDLMLRRAVGRAMNQTLADPALQALASTLRRADADDAEPAQTQPDPRDDVDLPRLDPEAEARIEALRADLGRSLTLEIEVAGELIPLVGRTLRQMSSKIESGVDGLAIRREQQWSHQFASHLRVTNTLAEPEHLLRNLAISAGMAMSELGGDIGARNDVSFYRFRGVNLAQASPEGPAVELFRGDVLVNIEDVTRENLAHLADGIAQHMLANLWPDPPAPPPGQPPLPRLPMGARGDYSPTADQHQPDFAPPMEQALCAWALLRYAQCEDVDRAQAGNASAAAVHLLRDLAEVHPRELDPRDDPGACAVMLYIVADSPSALSDAMIGELAQTAAQRVFASFDSAGETADFRWRLRGEGEDGADDSQPLSPLAQAMLAGAMARLRAANVEVQGLALPSVDAIRQAIAAAWASVNDANRVALLPWLGWALNDLSRASGRPLEHADDLRRMIEALQRLRITADAQANPENLDVDGGFVLTAETDGQPRPSAQSLRPALWLARALRDERLVPPEQSADAWAGHLRTMRFVMQLAVSKSQAAMFRNPGRTEGGVCASVIDSRQPVAAQALGLVTAVETLQAW